MKKIALTVLIAASLSTGAAVGAEPFKNRGIDYRTTAQPDTSVQRDAVTAQANSFNDRGIDYVETISVSADTPRAEVNPIISGFNNRNNVVLNERQNLSKAGGEVRLGYSR